MLRVNPEARWLPSRSNFALFRLLSYLRLRNGAREAGSMRVALAIDRHQNAVENHTIGFSMLFVTVCYLAVFLERWLHAMAAIVIAVVAAPIVIELPFYATGLVVMPLWRAIARRKASNNLAASSLATMSLLFVTSAWFALRGGRAISALATVVLAAFAANALSAVAMWLLRKNVRELENRCGA